MAISMPTPTNLPVVPSRNSLKAFLSKYCECGSRLETMPTMASVMSFLLVHRLDVVALDHAKHGGELLQLLQWQGCHRAARHGLQRHGRQCTPPSHRPPPNRQFSVFDR